MPKREAQNPPFIGLPTPTTTRVGKLTQNYEVHENELSDGVDSVIQLLEACGGNQKLFEAATAASTTISAATAKLYADQSDREFGQLMTAGAGLMKALPEFFDAIDTAKEKADKRREKEYARADADSGTVRVKEEAWEGLISEVNQLREDLRASRGVVTDLEEELVARDDELMARERHSAEMEVSKKKRSTINKGKSTETSLEA